MRVYEYNEDGCLHTLSVRFQYAGGETAMPKQRFYLATDVQALAEKLLLICECGALHSDKPVMDELRAIVEGK